MESFESAVELSKEKKSFSFQILRLHILIKCSYLKFLNMSLDLNLACQDRMPSLYHLCHHHFPTTYSFLFLVRPASCEPIDQTGSSVQPSATSSHRPVRIFSFEQKWSDPQPVQVADAESSEFRTPQTGNTGSGRTETGFKRQRQHRRR